MVSYANGSRNAVLIEGDINKENIPDFSKAVAIEIGDAVSSVANYAFSNCTGLTSLTIPDSVTSIGESAFVGCTGLTDVTIPDSVTSIKYDAFSGCTGLTGVTFDGTTVPIG